MTKAAAIFDTMIKAAPVRMWALIGAGPAITAIDCGLILIIWLGAWPPRLADEQLRYIGILAIGHAAIVGMIVVTLAAARASAHGPGGFGFDVSSAGTDPNTTTVTQRSETVVKTEPPPVPVPAKGATP